MLDSLMRHRSELARALRNHRYETMDDGRVLFPAQGVVVGGVFRTRVNGGDEQIDPNVLALAGLSNILAVYFDQAAQTAAHYIAPFSENEEPANTLTAANFNSTLTEFTNYTQSTRPTWAKDDEASQSIANAGTPARFTMDTGGGTIWGAALMTASAKSSTSGLLVCCAKFAVGRVLLAGDNLDIEYEITAADGGA